MYKAILREDNRIIYVFNTETADDDPSNSVEVPVDTFKEIWQSGRFGDWVYNNGNFSHDPEPELVLKNPNNPSTGTIPESIL